MSNYVVKKLELDLESKKQDLQTAREKLEEKTNELSSADQKNLENKEQQASKYYELERETAINQYQVIAKKAAKKADVNSAIEASKTVGKLQNGNMETSNMLSYRKQKETAAEQLENFENHLEDYKNDVENLQDEVKALEHALTFAGNLEVKEDTEDTEETE